MDKRDEASWADAFVDRYLRAINDEISAERLRSMAGLAVVGATWGSDPRPRFVVVTATEARESLSFALGASEDAPRILDAFDAACRSKGATFPLVVLGAAASAAVRKDPLGMEGVAVIILRSAAAN